eukprot:scaffold2534_cov364-Prasinococcus_capsulatus_cf.AAC.1
MPWDSTRERACRWKGPVSRPLAFETAGACSPARRWFRRAPTVRAAVRPSVASSTPPEVQQSYRLQQHAASAGAKEGTPPRQPPCCVFVQVRVVTPAPRVVVWHLDAPPLGVQMSPAGPSLAPHYRRTRPEWRGAGGTRKGRT